MQPDIHIRKSGKTGRITLTRPDALNALTYNMCLAIEAALDQWRNDDTIELVIIDSDGSRAFCAGGDIAKLYETGTKGDFSYGRKFWADEYRLNAKIHNYPKPYVAIMDGIVMGGGVGISAHGSHRIVTENTLFAMPECGIGLVPDVGGNWLLAKASGHIGEYLAMSGARLKAADCIHAGIADLYVEEAKLGELTKALEETADLSLIKKFSTTVADGDLPNTQQTIDAHFSKSDAKAIIASLEGEQGEWFEITAKLIRKNCPLSVACAFEIVRKSWELETIEQVLELEYRFTYRSMSDGDFLEGIRAQIIDKDRNPKWNPPLIEEVVQAQVDFMLAPLEETVF